MPPYYLCQMCQQVPVPFPFDFCEACQKRIDEQNREYAKRLARLEKKPIDPKRWEQE